MAALPGQARQSASESVSGAYAVAERIGVPAGDQVIGAANEAFVAAMHWAAAGSALVAVLGILVALRWLPGRHPAPVTATVTPVAGDAPPLTDADRAPANGRSTSTPDGAVPPTGADRETEAIPVRSVS